MRQSLSEIHRSRSRPLSPQHRPGRRGATVAVVVAVALSLVLLVVALVDHVGAGSLLDHTVATYALQDAEPQPAVLYGVLYTVAAVALLLWLGVLRAVRSGRGWAAVVAGAATAVSLTLGLALLTITEYGTTIFPPLWGVLALAPAPAGAVAVALLVRRARRV